MASPSTMPDMEAVEEDLWKHKFEVIKRKRKEAQAECKILQKQLEDLSEKPESSKDLIHTYLPKLKELQAKVTSLEEELEGLKSLDEDTFSFNSENIAEMVENKPTILLHYNGYWTRATIPNQMYANGKEVMLTVNPSTIRFRDIVSQVPQVEERNHEVKISYNSPLSGLFVELEDDAGLVKMFDECRGEQCIELYSVLKKPTMVARENDKPNPPQACLEGSLLSDPSTAPLTGSGEDKKRKRMSDTIIKQLKKVKMCEGLASHMASAISSTMQTLESDYEILDGEELWNLLKKLEATLRQLRLQRVKKETSSPIEIEDDDDYEEDMIDSFISGQNKISPEKIASSESSAENITEVITTSQSDLQFEQTQPNIVEMPSIAMCSTSDYNVACTGKEAVEVPISHSDSSVKNTLHKEAPIDLFGNLAIAENVPVKDKIALDAQLSMLKAGSKAIVEFLKCPFDENALLDLQNLLKIVQATLNPEFDKYFGTKPREQIQCVSNFVSSIQTFQAHNCTAEAELIYQNIIEKCKNSVKYAEEDLHQSLHEVIKACDKSRLSKEKFRDVLLDFCVVAESLDCALRSCNRKREQRRKFWRDYVRNARIVEGSQCGLLLAEESKATEVLCISEKIIEERKQKLFKEAEVLLATMMN